MISIRLSKIGKKNRPSYKIVVTNKRSGRDGLPLETLGYFDPNQKQISELNSARLEHWRKIGAQLSTAVEKILAKEYKFKVYIGSKSGSKES
jgi:small subunit ribosomal protein S16